MAERIFLKTFEDFKGLDYRRSPLASEPGYFDALTNYKFGEGFSLRGRRGCQVVGQAGSFIGLHTFKYLNRNTNAITEEMLAINDNLWKLSSNSIVITRGAGSTNWYLRITLDAGSTVFRAYLVQNSVNTTLVHPVSGESADYLHLGNGLEADQAATTHPTTGVITIMDLAQAIDATANFSCPNPTKSARVNGNQSGVRTINVDAGHTISAGDVVQFWDWLTNNLVGRRIISTTGTSITFSTIYPTVDVKDNQCLGNGATPAISCLLGEHYPVADPTLTLSYYTWSPISFNNNLALSGTSFVYSPFADAWALRESDNFIPPIFINHNNACYISALSNVATKLYPHHEDYSSHIEKIFKYDGQNVYRMGLPKVATPTANLVAGALTGRYKYVGVYRYVDAQGVTIDGDPSEILTVDAAANNVNLEFQFAHGSSFSSDIAKINGTQIGVTSITVDAGHALLPGDIVVFYDRAAGVDNYTIKTLTAITATTVTFAGAVDVLDNDFIWRYPNQGYNTVSVASYDTGGVASNTITTGAAGYPAIHGFEVGDTIVLMDTSNPAVAPSRVTARRVTAVASGSITFDGTPLTFAANNSFQASKGMYLSVYRTVAGGNQFYLQSEWVSGFFSRGALGFGAWISDTDSTPDASLGEAYFLPLQNLEPFPSPRARIICSHQGCLVAGASLVEPNTLYYTDTVNPEGFPIATKSLVVPAGGSEGITAIYSDDSSRLAVFKETSYIEISGDFPSDNINARTVTDGDYGVSSQASLAKVNGILVGVGKLGPVGFLNGQLVKDVGWRVAPVILNNPALALTRAIGFNDWTERRYHLYVPSTGLFQTGAETGDEVLLYLDYEHGGGWFDGEYEKGIEPSRGITIWDDIRWHLSGTYGGTPAKPGHLFKELSLSVAADNYADNHVAPHYTIEVGHDCLGEPSLFKEFLRLGIFSMPVLHEASDYTGFTLRVQTYKDFQDLVGDSDYEHVFASISEFVKRMKLKTGKGISLKIVIKSTNSLGDWQIKKCPIITGFELLVAASYIKEDFPR